MINDVFMFRAHESGNSMHGDVGEVFGEIKKNWMHCFMYQRLRSLACFRLNPFVAFGVERER